MIGAPTPIEPESIFSGLSGAAILRGAILDVVLTVVTAVPIALFFVGPDALSDDPEIANRAFEQASLDPRFLIVGALVGLIITTYAAYWAARRAGVFHLRHGGWTAVASAAMGSLFLLAPGASEGAAAPLWYDAITITLMLPAGVCGGWLASKRHSSAD